MSKHTTEHRESDAPHSPNLVEQFIIHSQRLGLDETERYQLINAIIAILQEVSDAIEVYDENIDPQDYASDIPTIQELAELVAGNRDVSPPTDLDD